MPSGGARPNSGPQKGAIYTKTLEKRLIQERIKEFVSENLDEILFAMKDKAMGCHLIDKSDSDGERIYDLPPDPAAAKLLIEHAAGKPAQAIDVTSKGEKIQPSNTADFEGAKLIVKEFEEKYKQLLQSKNK